MSEHVSSFLVRLGTALHRAGASSARVEESLASLSGKLGVEAQFFASPTALFASFGTGESQRTYLSRVDPSGVDFQPLTQLDALIQELAQRAINLDEAERRLDEIVRPRPPRRLGWLLVGHMLASLSAAAFLAGGWNEMRVAACCGSLVGVVGWSSQFLSGMRRAAVPLTAALVSFVAVAAAKSFAPVDIEIVTLASLIVMLPGMTMTVAMTELATQHLASGIARLASSFLTFLMMAFGISLGGKLATLSFGVPAPPDAEQHLMGAAFVASIVAPLAIAMLLRAPRRDWGFVVLGGMLSLAAVDFGSKLLGAQLGPFFGGFCAAACGNIFARMRQRPSSIVFVPALLMVVPGSIGFRAVSALLVNDVTGGIETAVLTLLNVTALVTGMLIAGLVVHPRRTL